MTMEVITTQQLFHHRWIAQQIDEAHNRWQKYFSWYPIEQANYYKRYGEIYKQSLEKYGEKEFEYYSRRMRLGKNFRATDASRTQEMDYLDEQFENAMGHLINYKPSVTTNGEYGLIPPNRLFDCFSFK